MRSPTAEQRSGIMKSSLFALLAILFLVLVLVFTTLGFVYINRLRQRTPVPKSEDVGAYVTVLGKLRKRQPMSEDEVDYAAQFIADRRHLLAYSIPAAIFSVGCFYVFGSLEHLHGATPSE